MRLTMRVFPDDAPYKSDHALSLMKLAPAPGGFDEDFGCGLTVSWMKRIPIKSGFD